MLNKNILSYLVCPKCKGPLKLAADQQELICEYDQLAYRIDDGIPVMITDQARSLQPNDMSSNASSN